MVGNESKRSKWRRRIERQRSSERTVEDFCLDEGIAPATFYYWKRILRCELTDAAGADVRSVGVGSTSRRQPPPIRVEPGGFFPVSVLGDAGNGVTTALEIEFPHGVRLHVRPGCDLGLLREVLDWCRTAAGGEPC